MMGELSNLQALILDMDGVLWRSDQPIVDLEKVFGTLREKGLNFILVTNNSTRTVDQYVHKLQSFGVDVKRWQVLNSSEATAQYLHDQYPTGGPVYIVGEEGLISALSGKGFEHSIEDPLAVVAGLDRQLTYEKIDRATHLIRSGCPFVATNPDRTIPTPRGLSPGAGSVIAAIEAATDVKPYVVGKPAAEMFRVALERLGASPDRTLMVGDRLETDIAGAQRMGIYAGVVLSGVSTPEQAHNWKPEPDLIEKDITELLKKIS